MEQETNSEFGYGHGHYDAGARARTVMSQSAGNCDNPLTGEEEVCHRERMWSDPHRYFFGTTDPAGTAESWNARVLFATGPHIASIRGDAQNYDSAGPTGNVTLPDTIPARGTLQISAAFSEPIHEWFPPVITITDGIDPTAAVMTRSSETEYTYSHLLDGEQGTYQILFSNARDLFGNPVVKTPTSGGSFVADAADAPPQPPPTEGAVHSVNEDFQRPLPASLWSLLGDGRWAVAPPTEGVPDEPMSTNRVVASKECRDSCILLLNPEIDTSEPLMISFDRYVDRSVGGRDRGLHVEYSTDRTEWNRLASYTQDNGQDTDRWERTVLGISIPENWAELRFNAVSRSDDDHIEIDNLAISRPGAVVPDVTFTAATGEARNSMILALSRSTSHEFSRSDFALSNGTVSSVHNVPNSAVRNLMLSGTIPYDTPVTVTYSGPSVDLGDGAVLHTGTSAVAIPVPSPDRPPVISMISDVSVAQGGTATRQVTAFDPDGDAIALSVSDGPSFVTLTDAGDGSGTVTIRPTLASHVGSHAVTVEAASNSLTAGTTFAVTVTGPSADTTPPVITVPGDVTAEATGALTAVSIGQATATDDRDPSPDITDDAPDAFPLGDTIITWTATDDAGNSATATQTVTVLDTTPPAVTAPADYTADATGTMTDLDADDYGTATATDLVDPDPEITSDAPSSFPVGATTITWTATDASGNSATATQTVTVRQTARPDTTAPVITAPSDITAEATGILTAVSTGQATATDDRDSDPEITSDAPASFPLGDTVITWTATDASGNSATAAQTVTVRDTTPPAIVPPPDIEVVAPTGGNATVYFAVPEATDLADPDVDVSCAPASGSAFPAGATTVTCTAADGSGNRSAASFEVQVTAATRQDVLFRGFEGGSLDGWTKSGVPRWHIPGPSEGTHPPGHPDGNRVAASNGCRTECVLTLSSPVDLTPYDSEVLTLHRLIDGDLDPGEYLRLDAFDGSAWRQLDRWAPEDSDDDDAWHPERYALDAYTDAADFKVRFASQMSDTWEHVAIDDVRITAMRAPDTAPPVIAAPPDAAFEATAPLTPLDAGDYGAATATDGSGAPPEVTSDAPDSFPLGDTVVTWTATDASGNTATATQTVTIRDTVPPVITSVPGDLAVLTHHGMDAEVAFAVPEAADVADPDAAVSCAPGSGSGFPVGSTTVSCTATDSSGNESRASFEVRVGQYEATATVSRTVTGEGATWTVAGPAAVFAGGTYGYTVTLESGTRPLNEALAIYSDTSTVDDFGQYADGAGCEVAFCAGFPGQAGDPYELDNHGGSAYDIRYRAIGAAGPEHVIALQAGGSARAGAEVTVGLMDRHGNPRGGVQVTVADPASASTLGRQLVSHLAFEGDVRDSAGDSHGTVNGTARYVDGAIGRAFYFDGSTYVALANEERFDFELDDPFSAAFWFKRDGPDDRSYYILAKKDAGEAPGQSAWIWDPFPGRIHLRLETGTEFMGVNTMGANLTDGAWHHVAFTYDGSGTRGGLAAYVDGIEGSDRRMALSLNGTTTNDEPLTLGALGSGREAAREAAIDELRVYSRELTASEAFALYAEGTG